MTDTKNTKPFPRPAKDALEAEGDALYAAIEEAQAKATARLNSLTKADLIAEATNEAGSLPHGLKKTDPKDKFVKRLARDVAQDSEANRRLRELNRAEDREGEIVRKAFQAETVEHVREVMATEVAAFIADRGQWAKDEVLDLVVTFEIREIKARCWHMVRHAMEEQQMAPRDALIAVREEVQATIVRTLSNYGRSSSATSNMISDAGAKGYASWLDRDLQYLGV